MSEQPEEDREPPRLQDTTERSALPLPLPDSDAASQEPAVDEPAPAAEPVAEEPAPADKAASVAEPPGSPNGGAASSPFDAPPFSAAPDEGPSPEMLLGAAFLGGVALAFLIRRLGR